MKDLLLWNKISRIVMLLAECLDISPVRALDIFIIGRIANFCTIPVLDFI